MRNQVARLAGCVVLFAVVSPGPAAEPAAAPIFWRPGDISSRDLFYGSGGKQLAPGQGPFVFLEEDLGGTKPKIIVRDAGGIKWKVKLGAEARPETVATRFLWAVGYTADTTYFVPKMRVRQMPAKLRRGAEFVSSDGFVHDARWERMDAKNIGQWSWQDDSLESRELNGARVMMALMNNWDLNKAQNAIQERSNGVSYVVSDLGATFGTTGTRWPGATPRGNVAKFDRSDFIKKVTDEHVDFGSPSWPMMFGVIPTPPLPYPLITSPLKLLGRNPVPDHTSEWWIGKHVPRSDVRWIAGLLGQLSPKQIRDAFRAAHYSPDEVEGFSKVMERRIAELSEI